MSEEKGESSRLASLKGWKSELPKDSVKFRETLSLCKIINAYR